MSKAIYKKVCLVSVFCIAVISSTLYVPKTCYGEAVCPISLGVEVSPYQVNIDSGGEEHYVRVLTYTQYSNTAEAFVYINDEAIESEYIQLTRDSVGHLVVKVDLDALKDVGLIVDTFHDLKISVVLKADIDGCYEKEGVGGIYIIGKQGN